jgi:hypothetical protein
MKTHGYLRGDLRRRPSAAHSIRQRINSLYLLNLLRKVAGVHCNINGLSEKGMPLASLIMIKDYGEALFDKYQSLTSEYVRRCLLCRSSRFADGAYSPRTGT